MGETGGTSTVSGRTSVPDRDDGSSPAASVAARCDAPVPRATTSGSTRAWCRGRWTTGITPAQGERLRARAGRVAERWRSGNARLR